MFWSIKYIHKRGYKNVLSKWKDSKVVSFVHFSNKRRFEQIYKTSLWNETVRQITEVFCKKGVLRNFTKFTWKHLCWSLFFNKVADLRPETLLKRDANAGVFRRTLWNFLRAPFLQNPSGGCFFIKDSFCRFFVTKKVSNKSFPTFWFN